MDKTYQKTLPARKIPNVNVHYNASVENATTINPAKLSNVEVEDMINVRVVVLILVKPLVPAVCVIVTATVVLVISVIKNVKHMVVMQVDRVKMKTAFAMLIIILIVVVIFNVIMENV